MGYLGKVGVVVVVVVALAGYIGGAFAWQDGPRKGYGPGPGGHPGGQYPPPPPGQGPFNDEVFAAVSDDGLEFDVLPGPLFRHASVPDVVILSRSSAAGSRGTMLLYFVDFSDVQGPGSEGISRAVSRDGLSWRDKQPIVIEGKVNKGAAVDPSLVQLPDGRIRLYFFGSQITAGDPAAETGKHKIYSAISSDGVNFRLEPGLRFAAEGITDPEVVRVGEEWLMFLSRGPETLLARSGDGLEFTSDRGFRCRRGGVPGALSLSDGRVRLFLSAGGGIVSLSFDPGQGSASWADEGLRLQPRPGSIVADPSPVILGDGRHYLVFKKKAM
ncbi:MAG: hypothetical protein ACE5GG_05400 [Candidatus Omnitrophota bacterium]